LHNQATLRLSSGFITGVIDRLEKAAMFLEKEIIIKWQSRSYNTNYRKN
jgi:hypothetical protein